MRQTPIVTLHNGAKTVRPGFHTNTKTNFKRNESVSPTAVRSLFQQCGTIEAVLKLLALKECEGDLTITVKDGVAKAEGNIITYHEVAFFKVDELVEELCYTAECLANQFEAGKVTITISFSQTLKYKTS